MNAKIDSYIEKNPKEWSYIQSMPRARLERSLALQAVQKEERREKLRESVMKKLDANPEMKEAYRILIKNLPEEQQEKQWFRSPCERAKPSPHPLPSNRKARGSKLHRRPNQRLRLRHFAFAKMSATGDFAFPSSPHAVAVGAATAMHKTKIRCTIVGSPQTRLRRRRLRAAVFQGNSQHPLFSFTPISTLLSKFYI